MTSILLATLALPAAPTQAAPRSGEIFTVDTSSSNALSSCSPAVDNDCSLRGAINRANATTVATIYFDPDVSLIALLDPLPAITASETWILGNANAPRIDAFFMSAGDVFTINGNDIRIANLSIVNGHTSASTSYADIRVAGGQRVKINHNYLGTLPPSSAVTNCTPNPGGGSAVSRNSTYGVRVDSVVTGDSDTPAVDIFNNTIGCHPLGIWLSGADYVTIDENWIGLNSSGVRLAQWTNGVRLSPNGSNGARYNTLKNNRIAGNTGSGIQIVGTGINNSTSSAFNLIEGNLIGLSSPSVAMPNGGDGIELINGAFWNRIGGSADSQRNLISGNQGDGISITNSDGNGVLGNYIGTNSVTTAALANQGNGILIEGGKSNLIGAYFLLLAVQQRENVISGNQGDGVEIRGATASNNLVTDNIIGTSAAEDRMLRNAGMGILVADLAPSTVITGNLIAFSGGSGVGLDNTRDTQIKANNIAGNAFDGITMINGSSGVIIGAADHPPTLSDYNMINEHRYNGVLVSAAGSNNVIGGNYIYNSRQYGIHITGTSNNEIRNTTVSYNHGIGVRVASSSYIAIGGLSLQINHNAEEGLRINESNHIRVTSGSIAENRGGIVVTGASSLSNFFLPTTLRAGVGPAIDLGGDGATANDPGDGDSGANGLLNYPVITSATDTLLSGSACANCRVYVLRASGNPGAGGGYIGNFGHATANGSGSWTFTLPSGYDRSDVTLMACGDGCSMDASSSSELSPHARVYLPLLIMQASSE